MKLLSVQLPCVLYITCENFVHIVHMVHGFGSKKRDKGIGIVKSMISTVDDTQTHTHTHTLMSLHANSSTHVHVHALVMFFNLSHDSRSSVF